MKKVFLTIALAAFAFAANAQLVVGGSLGFNTYSNSTNYTNVLGNTTTEVTVPGWWGGNDYIDLTVMPKVGYQLNDNMQVGLAFGINWSKEKDYSNYFAQYATIDDFEGYVTTSGMSVGLTPYFRYNLAEVGDFTLFCEAQLGLNFGLNPTVNNYHTAYSVGGINIDAVDEDQEGIESTSTNIALVVVPGLNYKLGDNLSLDVYANVLRLGFEYNSQREFRDNNVIAGISGAPTDTDEWVTNSTRFILSAGNTAAISVGLNYHF